MALMNHGDVLIGEFFEESSREVRSNPPPWALSAYFYDRNSLKISEISVIESYLEDHPIIKEAYEGMLTRSKERRARAVKRQTT